MLTVLPDLSAAQMVAVDRAMIEDYQIELIQMMENAGRNLAQLARTRFLGGDPRGKRVVVLAGTGGNGGGALVAARRLHTWGAEVVVALTKDLPAFKAVLAHQLGIIVRLGIQIVGAELLDQLGSADAILDGVIGYSLPGSPHGTAAELIRWANRHGAPILALDTPSGLDVTTGTAHTPTITAAAPYVGELYLADISVPPQLYTGLGLAAEPIFAQEEIIRLR